MPEITMPRLSDTMTEGTLARWLKKPGDTVAKGDALAEIETDKATMELESYEAGVLEQILVQEGQTVPIGKPIGIIGSGVQAGTSPPSSASASPATDTLRAAAAPAEPPSLPAAQPVAGQRESRPAPPPEASVAAPAAPTPAPTAVGGDGRAEVKASPMARAVAREHGIDLRIVQGTGPGGRIIRADVEAALAGAASAPPSAPAAAAAASQEPLPAAPAAAPTPAAGRPPSEDVEEIPLSNMRRIVARRLVESVQSAPHFYLFSVVDIEALVALRAQLNERLTAAGDETRLTLNDLLVKACALTLRANPDVNVSFADDKLLRHKRINIGIAVAIEGGLVVPVIRDADQKSVSQISVEARALIESARAGKLAPADFTGGTFTISNLGMFGIDHFTSIINPPEAAILAVGAIIPEPVVRDGQITARQTLKLTLSIDHRALDGAIAARFLQYLRAILEEPLRILV